MGALFETVRERVTALEAAQAYGMEFGRNRRARCPWHDDKHPDLAFYDGRCYCHACHEGGDAVSLTARLFGLTPLEAARKLNADFRLGADETAYVPTPGPSRAQRRRALEAWRNRRFDRVCRVEREAKAVLERGYDRMAMIALGYAQDELELLQIAQLDDLEEMREAERARIDQRLPA